MEKAGVGLETGSRVRAAAARYRELVTGTAGPEAAERFCHQLLGELRAGLDDAAIRSGLAACERSSLARVLLALLSLEGRDLELARQTAQEAMALDARDTLAQQLFARALGTPATGSGAAEDDLAQRYCRAPFEHLDVEPGGRAYMCCPAWLPVPIGDLAKNPVEEVWNSPQAQAIRQSILDGSFRYCSRVHCPKIAGRELERRDEVQHGWHRRIIDEGLTELPLGPSKVVLSYDRSCNLTCPSCRTGRIMARNAERQRLDAFAERSLLPLLATARTVNVTGSGDPFASGHFRWLIRRLERPAAGGPRLQLQTNGVLADERAWDELELEGRVESMLVSIDAATPATYARLRRGGSFDRLLDNLAFLGEVRARRGMRELRLGIVVQAANFRELPAAAELARGLGCDTLRLQMIRNWGTFSVAEFGQQQIGSPDHPDHAEFLEVLRHPSLDWPGVRFSSVGEFRVRALAG